MKQPIRPKTPSKPTAPKEYFEQENSLEYLLKEGARYTLAELIAKLPEGVKETDLVFRCRYFYGDSEYDNGGSALEFFYIKQVRDVGYERACKQYKKNLAKYEKKMVENKAKLAKYEAEMKDYLVWGREEKVRQEAEELKKLKKRVKELEKKVAV